MNLIIDDKDYGECLGYYQIDVERYTGKPHDSPHWLFRMPNGIFIKAPFHEVKYFTSAGPLEIITFSYNTKGR